MVIRDGANSTEIDVQNPKQVRRPIVSAVLDAVVLRDRSAARFGHHRVWARFSVRAAQPETHHPIGDHLTRTHLNRDQADFRCLPAGFMAEVFFARFLPAIGISISIGGRPPCEASWLAGPTGAP
jgi:hypothetical protein